MYKSIIINDKALYKKNMDEVIEQLKYIKTEYLVALNDIENFILILKWQMNFKKHELDNNSMKPALGFNRDVLISSINSIRYDFEKKYKACLETGIISEKEGMEAYDLMTICFKE